MPGTVSVSFGHRLGFDTYDIDWTSDASGNVSASTVGIAPGYLKYIYVIPNLGATQPTDLFDVEVRTGSNLNLLDREGTNTGLNRPNDESSLFTFTPPVPIDVQDTIQVIISGAGNAKTGRVSLYVGAK